MSPFCAHDAYHQGLARACKKYDIAVSPYSSLSPLFRKKHEPLDMMLTSIAAAKGVNETQILLAWAVAMTDGPVVTWVPMYSLSKPLN